MRIITSLTIIVLPLHRLTTAQAQQANSCKQCSDQRHACTARLFRKNLPDGIRALHEKLQAKMNRAPQRHHIETVLSVTALMLCVSSFANSAGRGRRFQEAK